MFTIILLITLVILSILNTMLIALVLLMVSRPTTYQGGTIETIKDTVNEVLTPTPPARVISPLARDLNQLDDL